MGDDNNKMADDNNKKRENLLKDYNDYTSKAQEFILANNPTKTSGHAICDRAITCLRLAIHYNAEGNVREATIYLNRANQDATLASSIFKNIQHKNENAPHVQKCENIKIECEAFSSAINAQSNRNQKNPISPITTLTYAYNPTNFFQATHNNKQNSHIPEQRIKT